MKKFDETVWYGAFWIKALNRMTPERKRALFGPEIFEESGLFVPDRSGGGDYRLYAEDDLPEFFIIYYGEEPEVLPADEKVKEHWQEHLEIVTLER